MHAKRRQAQRTARAAKKGPVCKYQAANGKPKKALAKNLKELRKGKTGDEAHILERGAKDSRGMTRSKIGPLERQSQQGLNMIGTCSNLPS